MFGLMARVAVLGVAALLTLNGALAQEPPALAQATGAEKERIKGLIEQARKEGAISYIDGMITPATHDLLSVAFGTHYGLPDSFKVANIYAAPVGIITRLGQEMKANRMTFDVAAVASPAWVQGRL